MSWFTKWGSPCPLAPSELVAVGKVGKAHGVGGAFQCTALTDFPERFEDTAQVHVHNGKPPVRTALVESALLRSGRVVLKLAGIDTPEQAEQIQHYLLCVADNELVKLEEGEYYHFQLEGLRVIDENDVPLGILADILATPAHAIYVVRLKDGGQDVLVPSVPEYVKAIDIEQGFVRLRLPVEAAESDFC